MTTDAAEARLQLLDNLIAGVHHLEGEGGVAALVPLPGGGAVYLLTTDQVEAWLIEERAIAATATLGALPAHRHPAWVAGVRWAAAEADAQAAEREPVYILDITDHLRACVDDPERGVVPRDQAPTKYVHDKDWREDPAMPTGPDFDLLATAPEPTGRVIDCTRWDYAYRPTRERDMAGHVACWTVPQGGKPNPGDQLLLRNGNRSTRYRVVKMDDCMNVDPPTMWMADLVYDPREETS